MSYTPPGGGVVNFQPDGAYVPPLGNAVDFTWALGSVATMPSGSALSFRSSAVANSPFSVAAGSTVTPHTSVRTLSFTTETSVVFATDARTTNILSASVLSFVNASHADTPFLMPSGSQLDVVGFSFFPSIIAETLYSFVRFKSSTVRGAGAVITTGSTLSVLTSFNKPAAFSIQSRTVLSSKQQVKASAEFTAHGESTAGLKGVTVFCSAAASYGGSICELHGTNSAHAVFSTYASSPTSTLLFTPANARGSQFHCYTASMFSMDSTYSPLPVPASMNYSTLYLRTPLPTFFVVT